MPTPRKPTAPTAEAIDQFCASFDPLFSRWEERQAFRHYLIGLLLPREHNKTAVELAALVPGANRHQMHHFMHDATWDACSAKSQKAPSTVVQSRSYCSAKSRVTSLCSRNF